MGDESQPKAGVSEIVEDIAAELQIPQDNEEQLTEPSTSTAAEPVSKDQESLKLLEEQSSRLLGKHGITLDEGLYSWKEILSKLHEHGCVICPNECGQEFNTLRELTQHMKRCCEHVGRFKCVSCSEHFDSRVALHIHKNSAHSDPQAVEEENKSPKSKKFFQIEGISLEKPKTEDTEMTEELEDIPEKQASKKESKSSAQEKTKKKQRRASGDRTPSSSFKTPSSTSTPSTPSAGTTAQRKRGRPRKSVPDEASSPANGEKSQKDKDTSSSTKPKRARKAQSPLSTENTQAEQEGAENDASNQDEEDSEKADTPEPSPTPKKRGRPKKTPTKSTTTPGKRGPKPKSGGTPGPIPAEFMNEDGTPKKPAETAEDLEALKVILKSRKRIQCPGSGCTKSYISALGYQLHAKVCGLSSQERKKHTCPDCGKSYSAEITLKNHIKEKHTVVSDDDEEEDAEKKKEEEVTPGGGRARRKAASKCIEKVQKLSSDSQKTEEAYDSDSDSDVEIKSGEEEESEDDDDDDDDADADVEDDLKEEEEEDEEEDLDDVVAVDEVAKKPRKGKEKDEKKGGQFDQYIAYNKNTVQVPPEMMAVWKKELKTKKGIICKVEGCGAKIASITGMRYHMKRCGKDPDSLLDYTCKLCGRLFRSKVGCEYHVDHCHINVSLYSSDDNPEGSDKKKPNKNPNVQSQRNYLKSTPQEFRKQAQSWLAVLHFHEWTFPDLLPKLSQWSRVPDSEKDEYLPKEKMSPRFRIENPRTGKNVEDMQLPLFGTLRAEDLSHGNWTIFVGGPVWAMNWCPTPESAGDCDQYLAVCCHHTFDEEHSLVEKNSKGKKCIQIWNMGPLQKKSQKQAPKLCMIIAHDYGAVWDISWCPSGIWQARGSSDKEGVLSRLGLLALACEDGYVRLLSMPHPEELAEKCKRNDNSSEAEVDIFYATPTVELIPGTFGLDNIPPKCGAAWTLAWFPASPHRKLAAGFSDGTIAIWDLMCASPLQRIRHPVNQEIACFLPFAHFLAHTTTVRSLSWCPSKVDVIASGSYDRTIKVWDLNSTLFPVNSMKKSVTLEICWPMLWSGLFTVEEECFVVSSGVGGRYVDMVYGISDKGGTSHLCTAHCSTVWSCSMNDRANMIVTGSNAGELVGFKMQRFYISFSGTKQALDRRWSVYRTTLESIDNKVTKKPSEQKPPEIKTAIKASSHERRSTKPAAIDMENYEDSELSLSGMVKKYRLVYKDNLHYQYNKSNTDPEAKRLMRSETMESTSPMQANLQAIHKVRWNPNPGAYSWLCSGGAAGLLRVHCMSNIEI